MDLTACADWAGRGMYETSWVTTWNLGITTKWLRKDVESGEKIGFGSR